MAEENDPQQVKENLVDVSDGKWIPKERFDDAQGRLRDQITDLRNDISALKVPTKEKIELPSHSTIVEQVEAGELTQAEADEINAMRVREEVLGEVSEVMSENKIEDAQKNILNQYVKLVPDLETKGTDINDRVIKEYKYLQSALGHPADTKTQVTAVRSVLGALEHLEKRVEGTKILTTHEESGSSGTAEEGKSDWDKIPDRQKLFYTKALNAGGYPDQEACVAEWNSRKEASG